MHRWAPGAARPAAHAAASSTSPAAARCSCATAAATARPCCSCTAGCSRPTSTGTAPTRRSPRPATASWRSTTAATGAACARPEPFTLKACADDAAALLAHLKVPPVMAVGYSMGGPIASLLARDHPQLVAGVVLGATAMDWSGRRMRTFWRTMAVLRLALGLAPETLWQRGLRAAGFPPSAITTWTAAELSRGNSVDIAEAGRELGRFNSRSWIAGLDAPGAVIVTTEDTGVPPPRQRALAAAMRAPVFEVHGDHGAVIVRATRVQRPAARGARRRARPAGRRDDVVEGLARGEDGVVRCAGATRRRTYRAYHDDEWGRPVDGRHAAVREALPRGLPVRPLVADDPAQARGVPRARSPTSTPSAVAALRRRATSSGCSPTPGSSATAARSRRRSTTRSARSS